MKPHISVLLSVHNGERYLAPAMESILNQTCPDFEFIIVNDGSTDQSLNIILSYSDPRIRLIEQENAGLTVSLNRAAAIAKGEYLARQDADDISLPDRFEKQLAVMERFSDVVLLGTDRENMDSEGNILWRLWHLTADRWIRALAPLRNEYSHGSLMIRRRAFEEIGGYNPRYLYSQDYDLGWRLAQRGRLYNHPEVLYRYREHSNAISTARQEAQKQAADQIRLRILKEWLSQPGGFSQLVSQTGDDPVLEQLPDDAIEQRARRCSHLLGQLGVALCLAGRISESQWAFSESAQKSSSWSREKSVSLLMQHMPHLMTRWLRMRSGKFPIYKLFLKSGRNEDDS